MEEKWHCFVTHNPWHGITSENLEKAEFGEKWNALMYMYVCRQPFLLKRDDLRSLYFTKIGGKLQSRDVLTWDYLGLKFSGRVRKECLKRYEKMAPLLAAVFPLFAKKRICGQNHPPTRARVKTAVNWLLTSNLLKIWSQQLKFDTPFQLAMRVFANN